MSERERVDEEGIRELDYEIKDLEKETSKPIYRDEVIINGEESDEDHEKAIYEVNRKPNASFTFSNLLFPIFFQLITIPIIIFSMGGVDIFLKNLGKDPSLIVIYLFFVVALMLRFLGIRIKIVIKKKKIGLTITSRGGSIGSIFAKIKEIRLLRYTEMKYDEIESFYEVDNSITIKMKKVGFLKQTYKTPKLKPDEISRITQILKEKGVKQI